jgi:RND family efflux transporter MFP subunit
MIGRQFAAGTIMKFAYIAVFCLLLPLAGCKKANQYVPPPPPKVSIAVPARADVTLYLETTGNVTAMNEVNLVARVTGFLTSQNYVDGSYVKQGTSLFTIEQPPYLAKLQQAQAQEAAAKAAMVQAQQELARQAALRNYNVNSVANYQDAQAKAASTQADYDNAKANTEIATINYSYTTVVAPFDGIVTAHEVSVGQVVSDNGVPTQLSTIVQLKPIYVDFSVSEPDVQRIRADLRARGLTLADIGVEKVLVGLQTETGYPHVGKLDYTAPEIDPSSGTLSARGIFTNDDRGLLPGMFVRVRVPVGTQKQALLVPDAAIGTDQGGPYVLVVGSDDVVQEVSVTTGPLEGSLRVVNSGLKPTDQVVVDGLQLAIPGEKVAPQEVTLSASGAISAPAGSSAQ